MNKSDTRKELVARRMALTSHDVAQYSAAIARHLLQDDTVQFEGVVHVYTSRSAWNEVDTRPLINQLAATFPDLTIISSPQDAAAPLPTQHCQLILVPVLGFDDLCNRIGMGAGWYDRLLAQQPRARTIGLAFDCQKYSAVPVDAHDIPLDMIITEEATYSRL